MNKKVSFKVSLGGITSAICLLLMFMTGFMPLLVYTLPAIAGALLIVVVIEISRKWAFVTYASISILSLFITPDKEAAILFIFFMGYYPIIKSVIEKIKNPVFEWASKLILFNIAIIISYKIIINVFGIVDITKEFSFLGKYSMLGLLVLANIVFVIYDVALTRMISSYITWFRPKFLRKFR